jgi:hypothetical protein
MHFYHVAKLELTAERQEYLVNQLPKDTLYLDNLEVLALHIDKNVYSYGFILIAHCKQSLWQT